MLEVDVFFEEQNIHTMSAEGELMMTILASYAQEESLSVSENQKWRIKRNFEAGKPWAAHARLRAKNGVFVIVPEEVKRCGWFSSGILRGSVDRAIANRLNELGVPTRFEKTWLQDTISKMLEMKNTLVTFFCKKTFRTVPPGRSKRGLTTASCRCTMFKLHTSQLSTEQLRCGSAGKLTSEQRMFK
jgi:hypothetical protein